MTVCNRTDNWSWRLLCAVLLLVSCLSYSCAQDSLVMCSVGNSECTGDLLETKYADCCTLNTTSDVYYSYAGQCNLCGPVLNETDTLLVRGTATHQELQWSLHSDSVISVLRVVVTSTEEEENAPFQTFLGPTDYRTIFAGLQEGNTYIYTVIAVGENGGSSVPISITWVAGQSLLPTFSNFIQAATNSTSVSAEWTLTSNGIRPLLQMVVRWRDGLESEDPNQFPPESNVIFDFVEDIQEDGVRLSHEFKGLKPATRYAVLVEARNYVGISRTSFAMETEPTGTQNPSLPVTGGIFSGAVTVTSSLLSLSTLLTLVLSVILP